MLMEIAILFALILLNGLFAMSEMALVTARKARLQKLVDDGDGAAIAAVKLGEDPTRFLSTIQIGITSIGVLNGIVGEAALAGRSPPGWRTSACPQHAGYRATGLVVVVITYFSIVVGELVPKRLGQSHPETLARLVARPIDWLAIATKPFVVLLSVSTRTLLRVLGVREDNTSAVTEEEIHAMLAEGTTAGVIESHEHAMVRNVFRLDDRQIGSLMVPRADVVVLDVDLAFEVNLARIETSDHARFPVVRGGLDNVQGVVNARQWLSRALREGQRELRDQPLEPPLYVPETLTGMELLDNFRESHVHMAFVIDEYGEVQGSGDAAGSGRGHHRRVQSPRSPDLVGRAARGRQLAAGRSHPGAGAQGPAGPGCRARRRPRPLPDPERHGDAADRPPAQGGRRGGLGGLALRDRRHGRQGHRQGARDAPARARRCRR
jgi:putative hemolysin